MRSWLLEDSLKLKPAKCLSISARGVATDLEKVSGAAAETAEMRQFIGPSSKNQRFVEYFKTIALPLHEHDKCARFSW